MDSTFQVVSIVGEQVSFVPTKLSPLETAIVNFDEFYRPESMSDDDFEILKTTMKFLFSTSPKPLGDSKETTRLTYPPCQEKEKQLVLQSLLHRKRVLQQQLFDLGTILYPEQLQKKLNELKEKGNLEGMLRRKQTLPLQGKDTLLGDYHLQHWLALDTFIRDYDSQTLCIDVLDVSHKGVPLDLTDDNIRELLQQFVFFMLQGAHPLPDYTKTDPSSSAFVSRLKKNPMGDKFPSYLTTYKAKKLPIAPTIAKVLEATNLDPSSMRDEVKRLVEEEKKKLLVIIQRIIPPTDPIWTAIGDRSDIGRIVDALWEKIQEQQSRIAQLERELAALDAQKKACDKAQALFEIQKRRLDIRITNLSAELIASQESDSNKTRRIEELENEKRALEERIRANQAEVDSARGKDAVIAELRSEKQALEDELAQTNLDLLDEKEKVARLLQEKQDCDEQLAALQETQREKDAVIARLTQDNLDLQNQLAALQEQITQLEAEVEEGNAKTATIAELEDQVATLQDQVATLQDQLAASQDQLATLQDQLAASQDQVAALQGKNAEIASLTSEKQALADQVVALQARIQGLERDIDAGKGKDAVIVDLRTQLAALRTQKDAVEAQLAARDASLLAQTAELDRKQKEKEELLARLAALEQQLGPLRGSSADLASLQREAASAKTAYDRRISELERQKEECDAKIAEKDAELDRLQNENQDLKGEIFRLRGQNEELEELKTRAEQNIDELKREHQAAMATEKAKGAASEAARVAAETAAQAATSTLAAKVTELATAKAALESATTLVAAKETTIGELTRTLGEQEAALTNLRAELQKRTEGLQLLSGEAVEIRNRIQGLQNTIAELQEDNETQRTEKELVDLDLEAKLEQIAALELQLSAALAKQKDLETQVQRCEEEKKVLQASASGVASSTAELTGQLRVAEEERSAARTRIAELETSVGTLRRQLDAERERANLAEQDIKEQRKRVADHEETIKYFEQDIEVKQGELDKTGKRASDAEAKASELESRLSTTLADKNDEMNALKDELQDGFQRALVAQQSDFEKTLRDEKKSLQDSLATSSAEAFQQTQDEYEAALREQKERYEKVYAVVQRMATWIQSGEETGIEDAAAIDEDTPQAGPLKTIATKLGEASTRGSLSPTAVSRRTTDSTINLCYIVFLVTFLWQANFSVEKEEEELRSLRTAAGEGPENDDWARLHSGKPVVVPTIPRQKLLSYILPAVFNGGAKPLKTVASGSYAFIQGLYRELETRSAGATTRHEFAGKLYSESTIVRKFLHIFNKVARAMEAPAALRDILGLDALDSIFLDHLTTKFTAVLGDYKDIYRTPTFHLETQFPTMVTDALLASQPFLKKELMNQYLVKTPTGYRILTKEDKKDPPSLFNYATIFYCFLVVIRDYLNLIETTVYAQCPLPPILKRTKARR